MNENPSTLAQCHLQVFNIGRHLLLPCSEASKLGSLLIPHSWVLSLLVGSDLVLVDHKTLTRHPWQPWDNGKENGNYYNRVILGLYRSYRDNGKANALRKPLAISSLRSTFFAELLRCTGFFGILTGRQCAGCIFLMDEVPFKERDETDLYFAYIQMLQAASNTMLLNFRLHFTKCSLTFANNAAELSFWFSGRLMQLPIRSTGAGQSSLWFRPLL